MADFADQLARLRMMAQEDPTWDLSPNDRAAITAVLARYEALNGIVRLASLEASFGGYEDELADELRIWREWEQL